MWPHHRPLLKRDIAVSDGVARTDGLLRRELHHETQYGLHVRGMYGASLGILAIRCERHGEMLVPQTMAIADDAPTELDTGQSNPQRVERRRGEKKFRDGEWR